MIHLGKNTSSIIISKGISAGFSSNAYRGMVKIAKGATNAKNVSKCDSLLIGDKCSAHTIPVLINQNTNSVIEHEASTGKISEEQLFYAQTRGLNQEQAIAMIVNGFCKEVMQKLPMEFAVEATKLIGINLEGSVG